MNEKVVGTEDFEEPKSEAEVSPPQEAGATFSGSVAEAAGEFTARIGRRRWMICALLFFAATIDYVDRQVIGILKPTLQAEFGWSEIDYADIIFAFQLAYAGGFLIAGRMMDRIGARIGFTIAIVLWSLAAIAHAEATVFGPAAATVLGLLGLTYYASVAGFMVARFALRPCEASNFTAANNVNAQWCPTS